MSKIEFSPWPSSTICAGSSRASWRQSSLPIDPPAPVTRTVSPVASDADLLEVGLDRLAPQQVLDLDLPERGDADPAGDDVEHGRHRPGLRTPASSAARTTSRTAEPGARGIAITISSISWARTSCGIAARPPRTGRSHIRWPCFEAVVVDEADRVESQRRMVHQLLDDHLTRRPGSDDQGPPGVDQAVLAAPPAQGSNREPGCRGERRREQPIQQEHAERHPGRRQPERGEDHDSHQQVERS